MTTPSQEYCIIPLTKGQVALVDAADYEWLSRWKWHSSAGGETTKPYACRNVVLGGVGHKTVRMHREILGLEDGDGKEVDHIDCDRLNNRRQNLRVVTHRQNSMNTRKRDQNSTYKGVHWDKRRQAYRSQIASNGKNIHLGYYRKPYEAHLAYCYASAAWHGEFARFE